MSLTCTPYISFNKEGRCAANALCKCAHTRRALCQKVWRVCVCMCVCVRACVCVCMCVWVCVCVCVCMWVCVCVSAALHAGKIGDWIRCTCLSRALQDALPSCAGVCTFAFAAPASHGFCNTRCRPARASYNNQLYIYIDTHTISLTTRLTRTSTTTLGILRTI